VAIPDQTIGYGEQAADPGRQPQDGGGRDGVAPVMSGVFEQEVGDSEEHHGRKTEDQPSGARARAAAQRRDRDTADDDEHPEQLPTTELLSKDEESRHRDDHGVGGTDGDDGPLGVGVA